MKNKSILLTLTTLLAALLGSNQPASTQAWAAPQGNLFNMQLIGQSGGASWAVAASGNIAYVGMGLRLLALDVSDPAAPVLLDESDLFTDIVSDIVLADGLAYLAVRDAGLQIVDISNPAALATVGGLDTPGSASGLVVANGYAYVADQGGGLRIINVSTPTAPVEVASVPVGIRAMHDVAVSGNYAYTVQGTNGLYVYDITTPSAPSEHAVLGLLGTMYDIVVTGGYAYIGESGASRGLRVVDISDPAAPTNVGFWSIVGASVHGVAAAGNYVYVAGNPTLNIFDISDPTNPDLVRYLLLPGQPYAAAVQGSTVYVTTWYEGLRTVNVTDPANPVMIGAYEETIDAKDLAISGSYALMAQVRYGLHLVDLSNLRAPRDAGSITVPGEAEGVAVSGNYAYVAGDHLYIYDISDRENPTQVGFYEGAEGIDYDLAVSGNTLYAATGNELVILDISDPAAPAPLTVMSLPARDVALVGNLAYISLGGYGMDILDVTDPRAPVRLGGVDPLGYVESTAVAGDYAYMAIWKGEDGGLSIADISDPAAPVQVNFTIVTSAWGVAASGNYAYLGAEDGLHVFDVSDPAHPVEAAYFKLEGGVDDIVLYGSYILGAFRLNGGLIILRYGEPLPITPFFLPLVVKK